MTLRTLCTAVALIGTVLVFNGAQAQGGFKDVLCKKGVKQFCPPAPAAQPAPAPAAQPAPAMNDKQECVNTCFNKRRGQDNMTDEDLKGNCELECQSN